MDDRRIISLAVIAGFVEALALFLTLAGQIPTFALLAVHGLVIACAILQVRSAAQRAGDLRLSILFLASVSALGPLGAGATLLTAVFTRTYAKSARPFEEWYAALFPDRVGPQDILEKIRLDDDAATDSITPLIDVLTFGSYEQKQALIGLIVANFRPGFAPILKLALNDANNAIRVRAATAITKIEKDFTFECLRLEQQLEQQADSAEILKLAAKHYDDYAYLGLLDAGREHDCREKALELYKRYLVLSPGDEGIRLAVGRMLIRGRNYQAAVDWFERPITDEPASVQHTVWYMESLFASGDFEKLRQVMETRGHELANRAEFPVEMREVMNLWSNA